MAKNAANEPAQNASATREQLIQGLQDDISREYKAIIQYVIFSQKLDGAQYMNIADQLEDTRTRSSITRSRSLGS